ncbi:hypothetical protein F4821DRAFT_212768 [Hypoxylon rubiginosum]|uniref:Uncharacterized protein n=1 Tax=Hypoxylon rubiginosum TaxID=110542 RepID=A0ACC0DEK2_9PEZI|nr:hypothetical protein F4821DRAFT_212768 [Hypoxylon rubiginosum]
MTDWKGIVKNGWHPEKEGTSLRGQVKGLIGRGGDNSSSTTSSNHSATPITSLRDPSSFGPPPKRVGYDANAASPQTTGTATQQYQPHQQPHPEQTYGVQSHTEEPVAESKPYRVNTTGLDTSHLPPPPVRRDSPERRDQGPPPPLYSKKPNGPPSLPPRLPPRSGNASPVQTQSPVSTGGSQAGGYLNQGAISRLGAAGISVPGLGIGKTAPPPPARSPTTTTTTPAQGTTWAEKQAALKTASSFHKDPSSVSFADAKAAAGTAHSFHQRHGDQVASGLRTANGISQRFGSAGQNGSGQGASPSPIEHIAGIAGKKKPAPPPPAKKPQLSGAVNDGAAPPPVPMATRPNF